MANFSRTDLDFVLQQILISENDSAVQIGGTFNALPSLVGSPLLPNGLRYVNGSYNNLLPGQNLFGAADQIFPHLLTPSFHSGENVPLGFGTPNQPEGSATSYSQTSGFVFDTQPRVISNLIVDQTATNPAAIAAVAQTAGSTLVDGTRVDGTPFVTYFIPNVTPNAGVDAPYNSWFTLFGQFFDHGLDLVSKGQSGTAFIPLQPGDPLYDPTPGAPNFMTLTRASNLPGPDGIVGDDPTTPMDESADDIHEHLNQTTPFVDQSQTYTSHPSHQVFLREYEFNAAGIPVATGRMLENSTTHDGLPTWADIKLQAQQKLGFILTDADVTNVPLLRTDSYGKFIPGPDGFALLITGVGDDNIANTPDDAVIEGNPAAHRGLGEDIPEDVIRTGHAFLDDIAHDAVPRDSSGAMKIADSDNIINSGPAAPGEYDNELLDAHFITGDGRTNENIGLTAVHTIFHAEHNRTVQYIKDFVDSSNDPAFQAQWHLADGSWNGERLFQGARFATEMQYQHLLFEEFARKVQPNVNAFAGYDSSIDPAIMAEFAHVVYRFGHSMLTETVARTNPDGTPNDIGLIQAFLNPVEFGNGYTSNSEAAGAIVRGMTNQVGNEIDEFVTEALRNNLVGLPLDLAAINITRGRDTGTPGLNDARRMFYEDTGHNSALLPYKSWIDFGHGIRHPESLINFIAAYGTHPSILNATTLTDKRDAAELLVHGGPGEPVDRIDFMNSTGAYASLPSGAIITGLDNVDFWIGGLAEKQAPFGGLLGSTFNFVFETQMENLQDADRYYYLERTAGLSFLTELEQSSFSELIMRNLPEVKHLPSNVFSTPTYTFETSNIGTSGTILDDPATLYNEAALLVRDTTLGSNTIRYNGLGHVVMGGTSGNDRLRSDAGSDTLYGDDGNDRLEGGSDNDFLNGGAGDDIITDASGDDTIKGGDGNDVINGGPGLNTLFGGSGNDFVITGGDVSEVFAGPGSDFLFGNTANATMLGNEGDDWLENGAAAAMPGDNADPFGRDQIRGNDIFIGAGGVDTFNGEGGDDIMNGKSNADKDDGGSGFDWAVSDSDNTAANIDLSLNIVPGPFIPTVDRFNFVEAASGWNLNDTVRGDSRTSLELELVNPLTGQNNALDNVNNPASGEHNAADRIALINGFQGLLGTGVSSFSAGNILLGGAGSDLIQGRGGNDIIDGDAWLNVRISVRDANNPNIEIASFENMTTALQTAMQNGIYNPAQLQVVREIKTAPAGKDIDTALYGDVFANYKLTFNSDNSITVNHINPGALINDGKDTLRNIERLQFSDRVVMVNVNHVPTGIVTIDGTAQENAILTANVSAVADIEGLGVFNYQWLRDNVAIGGATGDTYNLSASDIGKHISVQASYTDGKGTLESLTSAQTVAVVHVNHVPTGIVTIDGTVEENATLTANLSAIGDADGLGAFSYQWLSDNVAIGGATGDTYNLSASDIGKQISVQVSYTDGQGTAESLTSAQTVAVVHVNHVPTGIVTIDGTVEENATLTANLSAIGDADGLGAFSYQWLRDGAAIGSAIGSTYALSNADVGKTISIQVSYIDGHGTPESLTSAPTAAVISSNHAPVLIAPLVNQAVQYDVGNLSYNAGTSFSDPDLSDSLIYSATLADGISPLPAWMQIDPANGSITGSPPPGFNDRGTYALSVKATDTHGSSVSTPLTVAVTAFDAGRLLVSTNGNDTFAGTVSNDTVTYAYAATPVAVSLAIATLQNTGGGGLDTLTNIDNLIGSNFNDTLTGNTQKNVLDGGIGTDTLIGGTGDDTYIVDNVGDIVTESGAGIDTIKSSVTYTLSPNVENLILIGAAAINGTGNSLANTITGNAADNTLNGAAGADILAGGLGNDIYTVDNAGDIVTENLNEGTDKINSNVTYILPGNVENLTLTGTSAINGTGNNLANILTGNSAANQLDGGVGADTLAGGTGNDTYFVDDAGDVITEAANAGTDTVNSSVTYTLSANAENLILTGVSAINGIGNGLANTITGNSGNNTLNGAAGADTLAGGLGNDTYIVDNAGDVITEDAGAGTDVVNSSVTYTLLTNVENLTLTGASAINGTGNDLANILIGNSANNQLNGGNGNDILNGGTGTNILTGGAGNDTFRLTTAGHIDTITDYVVINDTIQIENAVFTALTTTGALAAGQFVIGTQALDANDFIIYNNSTGALLYDSDGNGTVAAIQIATIGTGLAMISTEFVVI